VGCMSVVKQSCLISTGESHPLAYLAWLPPLGGGFS